MLKDLKIIDLLNDITGNLFLKHKIYAVDKNEENEEKIFIYK